MKNISGCFRERIFSKISLIVIIVCTDNFNGIIPKNDIHYTDQGCNVRKVISESYASFVYCSVLSLGDNVNTRQMSQPDMGSIFHIKNQ